MSTDEIAKFRDQVALRNLRHLLEGAGYECVEEDDTYEWWSIVVEGGAIDLRLTVDRS